MPSPPPPRPTATAEPLSARLGARSAAVVEALLTSHLAYRVVTTLLRAKAPRGPALSAALIGVCGALVVFRGSSASWAASDTKPRDRSSGAVLGCLLLPLALAAAYGAAPAGNAYVRELAVAALLCGLATMLRMLSWQAAEAEVRRFS